MITIIEANTPSLIKEFVLFPFTLYKNEPNWVPPIIADELDTFNKQKNPAFTNAEAYFYLAKKEGKTVGRIAAIINWEEVNQQQKSKVRFGWWDVVDDLEVTEALLEKVYALGRQNNLEYVEGPMGFSNLDKVGVVTEGFDRIASMITWYNFPYYKTHLEALGYETEKEYVESHFSFSNVDIEPYKKAGEILRKRYGYVPKSFNSTKEIMPYIDEMFALFNQSYARLSSFVAINQAQIDYIREKNIKLINPEYIKFVFDKNGKMVAFGIVMPSFSYALKKANGRLFPFGFLHLLRAKKYHTEVLFYLIGVDPNHQNKGVFAFIFEEYHKSFTKNGVQNCIRTPELADNVAIQNIWKNFNPSIFRRRSTYKKAL
ncbi:MAG: hypothetical protein RL607_862 [Bacteroidota bacterium]|jgi:hypothetical protein